MHAQQPHIAGDTLTPTQAGLVAISALTATGDLEGLKGQLHTALDAGLTLNEIKEALVQLYAYCGFPRSLNGINTFMSVVEERRSKGYADKEGKTITMSADTGKYERGRKVLEALTKTSQSRPAPGYGEFTPRIDAFLKEHLFADVFDSDVLSYQQRELITITALAAMSGLEPQLQSHIRIGKNMGLTEAGLSQVATLVEKYVSRKQANTLRRLLSVPEVPVIDTDLMVRIAEIEIVPESLEEYKAILKQEAAASVKIERGVIAIFPMYQRDNATQIRIVEIYANKAAYQAHLTTPHFLHYKTATLKMVKSLKLVDMASLDEEAILEIFSKFK